MDDLKAHLDTTGGSHCPGFEVLGLSVEIPPRTFRV